MLEEQLTHRIIGAFYHVYDKLGYGFVESVYQNALAHELRKRGLHVQCEVSIEVWYDDVRVGHVRADMIVERKVVVENKASVTLVDADWKQLLNCLSASVYEVGLLFHFGPKAGFKRLLYNNEWKAKRYKPERSKSP